MNKSPSTKTKHSHSTTIDQQMQSAVSYNPAATYKNFSFQSFLNINQLRSDTNLTQDFSFCGSYSFEVKKKKIHRYFFKKTIDNEVLSTLVGHRCSTGNQSSVSLFYICPQPLHVGLDLASLFTYVEPNTLNKFC